MREAYSLLGEVRLAGIVLYYILTIGKVVLQRRAGREHLFIIRFVRNSSDER